MTSTAVPPRPNTITGPKVGSSAMPAINSRAFGRITIGWTMTPSMRASGFGFFCIRDDVGCRSAHRVFAADIEPHAADVGFVDDIAREDLDDDVVALCENRSGSLGRGVGIAGEHGRQDRDAIGFEYARYFDGIEPRAPVSERVRDDAARCFGVRAESVGQTWRRLHQKTPGVLIADKMHDAAHGFRFGRVSWNIRRSQDVRAIGAAADPGRKDRFRLDPLASLRGRDAGYRFCDLKRRRNRSLHVEDENRVVQRIGEQRLQRRGISLRIGIADDVDRIRSRPGGRQDTVETGEGLRGKLRRDTTEFCQPVDCEHADTAAIGEHGEAIAVQGPEMAERFGGVEEFAQVEYAQETGAAEGGVIDRVGRRRARRYGSRRPWRLARAGRI